MYNIHMFKSVQDYHAQVQASTAKQNAYSTDSALTGVINQIGKGLSAVTGNPALGHLTQLSTTAYKTAKYGV